MKKLFQALLTVALVAIAFAVVAVIIGYAIRFHSLMWRRVARRYPAQSRRVPVARRLDTIVIAERGVARSAPLPTQRYRQYPGTWVAVLDDGLALSLVLPLNPGCEPLFLPFDAMRVERTDWALWPQPHAVRLAALPDIDLILGADTVRWIRERTGRGPFGGGD